MQISGKLYNRHWVSSMIGAVTDGVRDNLDFVGFNNSLDTLIEALERQFGKGQTTDKIQQQFYQLSQERGETVQEFAGRIEMIYKKLSTYHYLPILTTTYHYKLIYSSFSVTLQL